MSYEANKNITPKEIVSCITGYYAHGKSLTTGYAELKAGSIIPMHQQCA
ncbi:MAG TPA: hypothetical protein VN451_08390 [Chitinophagaceae bacterium]|nr:hypothetical protein [Chitinophagaceae bacterium]